MQDEISNRADIGRVLELVIDGLQPFVAEVLQPYLRPGVEWPQILEQVDRAKGIRDKTYRPHDLQILLRVLTERLGTLGLPFAPHLSHVDKGRASELRELRNRWAHHDEFDEADTYRATDTAERLMRAVGATTSADELAEMLGARRGVTVPEVGTALADPEASPDPATAATQSVSSAGINARVECHGVLSYAAAHNRISVVSRVEIENLGPARSGVVVRLTAGTAEGDISLGSESLLDLGEASTTVLREPDLRLDPVAMLGVEERRPGWVQVTIEHDGEVLYDARLDVDVLAARQWVWHPQQLAQELLASFVQPNHPAIAVLMKEASDLLVRRTGNGSLAVYDDVLPERVDAVVEAVFDAMKARDIRYTLPPASWGREDETGGQKIRDPHEVLEGGLGTCLDTTLTMAAAFEQIGIRPLLWLVTGHIFVGYWRQDGRSELVANFDPIDLINEVDRGSIGVVETTAIAQGPSQTSFEVASRAPRDRYLTGRPDEILGVTDVAAARLAGIYALPARTRNADGTTVVTEYVPPSSSGGRFADIERTDDLPAERRDVPRRVSTWKNALLDLTLRNRLINFTPSARYRLAVPPEDVAHLEDLVNVGKPLTLLPSDAIPEIAKQRGINYGRDLASEDRTLLLRERVSTFTDVTDAAYVTRFRALAYRAKTIEQETGANNLYLAFGTLIWRTNDRDIESPLILVPVRLETARGGRYRLVLDEAGASTPNYCLLEKLRIVHDLRIPGLAEPESDGAGIDIPAAFQAMRDAIASAGLPYRVDPTVDLAILQFAKFRLWKDLDENWEQFGGNSLVDHLIHRPHEAFPGGALEVDDDLDSLLLECPAPADASQLAAVAAAVAGETFVLEGPPGTGKSQTITNLLARATAHGKKVLFVAEKRAALDVVQRRLEEVGLGPLSLDLHDKSSRPAAVRQQLKRALDHRVSADAEGLATTRDAVDASRRSLARYALRLHEANDIGLSYYSARTRRLALDDAAPAEVPIDLVHGPGADRLTRLRSMLRDLPDIADAARPRTDHPWSFLVDPREDVDQFIDRMGDVDSRLSALASDPQLGPILSHTRNVEQITWTSRLADSPRLNLEIIDAAQAADWRERSTAFVAMLEEVVVAFASTPGLNVGFAKTDWQSVHAAAEAADRRNFFVRKRARGAVLATIASQFTAESLPGLPALTPTAHAVTALQQRVREVKALGESLPQLGLGGDWNPVTAIVASLKNTVEWAIHLAPQIGDKASAPIEKAWRRYYESGRRDSDVGRLAELADRWSALSESLGLDDDADDEQSNLEWWMAGIAGRDIAGRGRSAARSWNDLLVAVEPLAEAGLDDFRAALLDGTIPAEDALTAFDAGVAETSLVERAQANALDQFSAPTHDRAVTKYTAGIESLRGHQATAIPSQLLASRQFDAHSSSGQVGELRRQLERQRGGLGVRDLMDRYGSLILDLTPCVLMSPESVSRFLMPDRALFDIVVFDEASQIRVADAIGAMGRSRSVVVVGDSKQMPPTSFAEVTIQSDEAEGERTALNVVDEESILTECVTARVPSRALTWHYRSQDEVLIQFSNEHYYGNLSSFPSPLHATRHDERADHGISLVRLKGTFLRDGKGKDLRTNPVEARAIVEEILARFAVSPGIYPSLGVVTFNAPQRALIDSMLRDSGDERIVEALDAAEEGLFVKNLENVQGDERDTILFSTAFSANAKGVLPLNFGPVGMAGGERRLNVAITRARRQVIVFSSFDPSDMRTESTASLGLKHLRAYLELAASSGREAGRRSNREDGIDRHREEIADSLRARGLHVDSDVGLSDFRVDLSLAKADDPTRPLVAILLDTSTWASRATVADRDALPVEVLGNLMRWPSVQRVWMPEWLADRDAVLDRLVAAVEQAHQDSLLRELERDLVASPSNGPEPADKAADTRPVSPEVVEPESAATPSLIAAAPAVGAAPVFNDGIAEFVAWPMRYVGSVAHLDALPRGQVAVDVQRLINEIVAAEGPIHRVRLAKLVANAYGLERVAAARVNSILRCVAKQVLERSDAVYLWPETLDRATWTDYRRTPPGVTRPLEHVAPREIANAMARLARRNAGMYDDEIRRETLHEFGISRMTSNMAKLLDDAMAYGMQNGILSRTDSGLVVSAELT